MRPMLLAAGLCLAGSAVVPANAETVSFSINVETLDKNGVCLIALPRDDGMKLEFSVRAEDANLNVMVQNIPSDWVDAYDGENVPITIKPSKGKAVTIPNGELIAGFTYRAEGWGTKGADALKVLSTLKGGKTYGVEFGGHNAGSFEIQQTTSDMFKDYAYKFMQTCMANNGGSTDF